MKPNTNKSTDNTMETRRAERKRRRRRRQMMRTAVVLSVLLVLALVIALLVLRGMGIAASKRGETTTFLAVKAIEVEGDTRYTDEELIKTSGLYVGQSLLAVNKVRSHDDLLAAHPYLNKVEIRNSSFDTVRITVEETPVMGAVKLKDGWMIVGENNRALEKTAEKKIPKGTLRIIGAETQEQAIGRPLLDERSLAVCRTILEAASACELEGLTAIDMTEKTNVRLTWREGLEIVLGNESNIVTQIQAFSDMLPTFVKNNGEDAAGRLDMTSYADDDTTNDRAVFTPADLLLELSKPIEKEPDTTTTGTGVSGSTTSGGTDAATAAPTVTTTATAAAG